MNLIAVVYSFCLANHVNLYPTIIMQINCSTPLIVTGLDLGGSIAFLFTISLLESIQLGKNRHSASLSW